MNKYYRYPSLQYWGDGKDLGFTALFEEDRLKYSESGKFLADARKSRYIYTGLQGGSIMKGWMAKENEMIACCSDGTRPVIFKIERLDEE